MKVIRSRGRTIRGPAGTGLAAVASGAVSVSAIRLSTPYLAATPAAGTVVGTLSCVTRNGGLVNPVYTLVTSAGGDFQLVGGNKVATLPNAVPAGDYSFTVQVSAANLATPYQQNVSVRVAAGVGGSGSTAFSWSTTQSGPAPAALSGLTWTQPFPLSPDAASYTVVGYLKPIGGIGPFSFSANVGGYEMLEGGNVDIYFENTTIVQACSAPVTFTVRDGRGATWSTTPQTIAIASSATMSANFNPTIPNVWARGIDGQNWLRTGFTGPSVGITDRTTGATSADFRDDYGLIYPTANPGVPGVYPLTLTLAGHSIPLDLTVVQFPPIAYIEFIPSLLSTSTLVGTVIGQALATTPSNGRGWSISDPSNTLQIDGNGIVTVKTTPAAYGPITFAITCTDNRATTTATFTINVAQGNIIASSAMSFGALRTTFNNDTVGNVLGTIPTPAGVTGTPHWSIPAQSDYNPMADGVPGYPSPPRYQIDQSGHVTAPGLLSASTDGTSAQTDTITVQCTDGLNSCTATFSTAVSWAPATVYYVGRGMAAAHGANGFDHLADMHGLFYYRATSTTGAGTWVFNVMADADPDYYAADSFNAYIGNGPTKWIGTAASGVTQPRLGGYASGLRPFYGDLGKGLFCRGNGDLYVENFEISHMQDRYNDGGGNAAALNIGGQTYGNASVRRCYLHDNVNNILTGQSHGQLLVENTIIEYGSIAHNGSSLAHGIYVETWHVTLRNVVFRAAIAGHDVKSRAGILELDGCRIFDGPTGTAPACIELPLGGQITIMNSIIEKGVQTFNADAIRIGAEGPMRDINTLTISNSIISVLRMGGEHDSVGGNNAIDVFNTKNSVGLPVSTPVITNTSFFLSRGSNKTKVTDVSGAAITFSETGSVMLDAPPIIDMTRPDISGTMGPPRPVWRTEYNENFENSAGVHQIPDRVQFRIPVGSAAGTVVCNTYATNDLGAQSATADGGYATANPFGAGTTWSIIETGIWYPSSFAYNPWASAKYTVTANSDGSAALKVNAALTRTTAATGPDYVQLRATAPNGTLCDQRYPIIVTA